MGLVFWRVVVFGSSIIDKVNKTVWRQINKNTRDGKWDSAVIHVMVYYRLLFILKIDGKILMKEILYLGETYIFQMKGPVVPFFFLSLFSFFFIIIFMLTSLSIKQQRQQYSPPSPPLSSLLSPQMTKASLLSNSWCPPESSSFLNLEKVVQNYGSQPELLELILSSKVEEDRRRAEEAKLRRKEIDYMLQQKKATSLPPISPYERRVSCSSSDSTLPRLQMRKNYDWKQYKRKNSIEMLLIPSPNSMELKLPSLNKSINRRSRSSSFVVESDDEQDFAAGSAPPSPPNDSIHKTVHKRRRREMQAITTIIETREFPYYDDYLWKNNGNTVHKKTGYKSIYYKCSNSSKGCPVNKTVTFKENGEYLIKYRGQHLVECNRIKRITDLKPL